MPRKNHAASRRGWLRRPGDLIDIAKENEIRRLHDVKKWKAGTIVAELGMHAEDRSAAIAVARLS